MSPPPGHCEHGGTNPKPSHVSPANTHTQPQNTSPALEVEHTGAHADAPTLAALGLGQREQRTPAALTQGSRDHRLRDAPTGAWLCLRPSPKPKCWTFTLPPEGTTSPPGRPAEGRGAGALQQDLLRNVQRRQPSETEIPRSNISAKREENDGRACRPHADPSPRHGRGGAGHRPQTHRESSGGKGPVPRER